MRAREPRLARLGHQDACERAAQRFGGGLGDRVQCLRQRERLRKDGCDPEEAALDPNLPRALLDARDVAEGDGAEAREGLQDLDVLLAERPRFVARRNAEDASHLPPPRHRRDHGGGEASVRLVRRLDLAVVARDRCLAASHRLTRKRLVGRELELDQLRRQPVDGGAAERAAPGVEQVAVGGLDVQELRHLDDEPLEDGLDAKLARHHLRGVDERRLPSESLLVLLEQLRCVDREAHLARDSLRERDVGRRPRSRLAAVEPEDADRPIEDDDRDSQRCPRAELDERLDPAERGIGQLGRVLDVRDGDRPALPQREVRNRQHPRGIAD